MELHPIHRKYIKRTVKASLETLLTLLDACDPPKQRDEALFLTFLEVIGPRWRDFQSVHERVGDTLEEHVSYNRFKESIRELAKEKLEQLLVAGIVHNALGSICNIADADIEETIRARRGAIQNAKEWLARATENWERDQAQEIIDREEEGILAFPQRVKEAQNFYDKFCQQVLGGLLEEDERRKNEAIDRFLQNRRELPTEEFPDAPRELPSA